MAQLGTEEFITRVRQRADLSLRQAENALDAVFTTLGERISGGELRDIASELPRELAARINIDVHRDAEAFDRKEFLERVAQRQDVEPEKAEVSALAVFSTLRDTISRQETSDTRAELPAGLKTLFEELRFQ